MFAKELLASIAYKCRSNKKLVKEERQYLAESIDKILSGLPADRALNLTVHSGAKRKTLSDRNINIYNRVEELLTKNYSKNKAFKEVAADTTGLTAKENAKENLTPKAVEKIYEGIRRDLHPKRTAKGS